VKLSDKAALTTLAQKLQRTVIEADQAANNPQGILQLPSLDPIKDLKIVDLDFVDNYKQMMKYREMFAQSKCHQCPKLNEQVSQQTKMNFSLFFPFFFF
jgi:hypothetical protein